jgi:hypothetical protein
MMVPRRKEIRFMVLLKMVDRKISDGSPVLGN